MEEKPCPTCEKMFDELEYREGDLPEYFDCPDCGLRCQVNAVTFDPSDPDFENQVLDFMLDQAETAGVPPSPEEIEEFKKMTRRISEIDEAHRKDAGDLM